MSRASSVFSTMTSSIMNVPNMGLKNFNLSLTIEGLISLYVGTSFKCFSQVGLSSPTKLAQLVPEKQSRIIFTSHKLHTEIRFHKYFLLNSINNYTKVPNKCVGKIHLFSKQCLHNLQFIRTRYSLKNLSISCSIQVPCFDKLKIVYNTDLQ